MNRLFDRIGGDALRRVLEDFYDRVFADAMIGFMFEGKNKPRLVQKEWELAAAFLGADVAYTGRPLPEAHRIPIAGGQFDRRLAILSETLDDHGVDPEVKRAWLAHSHSLRRQIIRDPDGACPPPSSEADGGG